jgi:hypothetical protein
MDSSVNAHLIAQFSQDRIAQATRARQVRENVRARTVTREMRGMSRLMFGHRVPVAPPAGTTPVPRV